MKQGKVQQQSAFEPLMAAGMMALAHALIIDNLSGTTVLGVILINGKTSISTLCPLLLTSDNSLLLC